MPNITITYRGHEEAPLGTFAAVCGQTVAQLLQQVGISLSMPCGGHHRCGKCRVWVAGSFSAPGAPELELLQKGSSVPAPPGTALRLACFCRVEGDGTVLLPAPQHAEVQPYVPCACEPDAPLFAAADLGTTGLVLQLLDAETAYPLAEVRQPCCLQVYGADVLSRIGHAALHGVAELHRRLIAQVDAMLQEALQQAGRQAAYIRSMTVVGNTAMLHFLAGADPTPLGSAPFTVTEWFDRTLPAEWFPTLPHTTQVYVPPVATAFLGADLLAGIAAVGLTKKTAPAMLVDIGTNGEMALWDGRRLLCCSAAAGPALEGAQISMGMAAQAGAIDRVWQEEGRLCWHTVAEAPAQGICGSGLVSAAACLLDAGVLDESGLLRQHGHAFAHHVTEQNGQTVFSLGESGVTLTQQDIRQLQLAKAAIAAGMELLLAEAGITAQELTSLQVAGALGSGLDLQAAVRIGLLPQQARQAVRAVGNTALQGAALLAEPQARQPVRAVARLAEEVVLAAHPAFLQAYVQGMAFPAGGMADERPFG